VGTKYEAPLDCQEAVSYHCAGKWDGRIRQSHGYDLHPKTYAWRTPNGKPHWKGSNGSLGCSWGAFWPQEDDLLARATHDWQNLYFQDFKFVNEYNFKICRIWSHLKFCKEDL